MPKPQETAKVTVEGKEYTAWTQVEVIIEIGKAWRDFGFTATEDVKAGANRQTLQVRPFQPATVELAGELVATGVIIERTANFDKARHSVVLKGTGKNVFLGRGAAALEGQKDATFVDIANKQLKASGLPPIKIVGEDQRKKFQMAQPIPGERRFRFLDRYARSVGISLGEDAKGNLIGFTGHKITMLGNLVEGKNILRAMCRITDESKGAKQAYSQDAGNDKVKQRNAAQVAAHSIAAGSKGPADLILSELRSDPNLLVKRLDYENMWTDQNINIQAEIVVQGWLADDGKLWAAYNDTSEFTVMVNSPMLMLQQELVINKVVFSQGSDEGTLTTLTLGKRRTSQQAYNMQQTGSGTAATTGGDGAKADDTKTDDKKPDATKTDETPKTEAAKPGKADPPQEKPPNTEPPATGSGSQTETPPRGISGPDFQGGLGQVP